MRPILLLIFSAFGAFTQAQSVKQIYPDYHVSSIDVLAFHESGLAIAALECEGILRSTDDGLNWTYIRIPEMESMSNIIFIDNDPNRILVSGTYGAYISEDGGMTFGEFSYSNIITDGARRNIMQLDNGQFLFLARTSSAISDDLIDWKILDGFPAFEVETEGPIVYARSSKYLMRSTDYLQTFDTLKVFDKIIYQLESYGDYLFIKLQDDRFFVSNDNGDTFVEKSETGGSNLTAFNENHLTFFNTRSWKTSKDGGNTWESGNYFSDLRSGFNDIGIRSDGRIYLAGDALKLIYTDDKGAIWNDTDQGRYDQFNDIDILGEKIVAVGDNGIMASSINNGGTWVESNINNDKLTQVTVLANGDLFIVDSDDIGSIIDGQNNVLSTFDFGDLVFDVVRIDNGKLVANLNSGQVFISTNDGKDWTELYALDASVRNIDFLSNDEWIATLSNGKIMHTLDAGISWVLLHDLGLACFDGTFESTDIGIVMTSAKMMETNDGWMTMTESNKPYNARKVERNGDKVYVLGSNSSNSYLYEKTEPGKFKSLGSLCIPHIIIKTIPGKEAFLLAGRGAVIERYSNEISSIKEHIQFTFEPLTIYPNPTSGLVKVSDLNNVTEVTIINTIGRSTKIKLNGDQFDISQYPNGIYIIQALNKDVIYQSRLLKI